MQNRTINSNTILLISIANFRPSISSKSPGSLLLLLRNDVLGSNVCRATVLVLICVARVLVAS